MASEKRLIEYINREEVCKLCDNKKEHCGKEKCPVYKAPTVDVVEVVHGRWVKHPKPVYMCGDLFYRYECSSCGRDRFVLCSDDRICSKYCEECGAKMDGDGNG